MNYLICLSTLLKKLMIKFFKIISMKTLNLVSKYIIGGIAFGLLFPLIAFIFDLHIKDMSFNLLNIKQLHVINSVHYIIDSVPIIISVVIYFVGNKIHRNEKKARLFFTESTERIRGQASILSNSTSTSIDIK